MPTYVFRCETCRREKEVRLPMDRRDKEVVECERHGRMKRLVSCGMTVLWAGKFHSPWAKKQNMDGLGSEW